jgi:hypothetical protein
MLPILIQGQSDADMFGKSKYFVVNKKNAEWGIKPCDDTPKVVTYCVSNGSKALYLFNNAYGTLTDIYFADPCIGQYQSENLAAKQISSMESKYGIESTYFKGAAYFDLPGVPYLISYKADFVDGAHWVFEGYHKRL